MKHRQNPHQAWPSPPQSVRALNTMLGPGEVKIANRVFEQWKKKFPEAFAALQRMRDHHDLAISIVHNAVESRRRPIFIVGSLMDQQVPAPGGAACSDPDCTVANCQAQRSTSRTPCRKCGGSGRLNGRMCDFWEPIA